MPDQSRDLNIALQEKVTLLEKALTRERNAKKKLEAKLDQKAEVRLYDNKEFFDSYEKATSRQVQLQFLASLTQELLLDKNIDESFSHFAGNVAKLLDACPVVVMRINQDDENYVWSLASPSESWQTMLWQKDYELLIKPMLAKLESRWHRIERSNSTCNHMCSELFFNEMLLYLIVKVTEKERRIILLDISHYCYSDDFKQTLDIAAHQFGSAIKRRMTKVELAYNIRDLRNTVSELKATQQQLVHSEKMSSLGQLAAGVAHEINNPIGYITSNLDVLKDYINIYDQALSQLPTKLVEQLDNARELSFAREDVSELLDSCIIGVERVTEIVASLKTFSRKEQDEFSAVAINDVIESALKIVWNKLKYDHDIVQELSLGLPEIHGNYGQLQQVFVNLFVNAAQAMDESGELRIESNMIDNYIEVKVHDTGCGMDESVIRRLFEPFYTTKDESEGTGLGLSVSYAIVEKHNAMISVNSEPNQGCTFTLKFPIVYS
ncbi:sensor histidine kinase [Cognaticolwellia mytili]|uniref:sensor histidine kinase n=1 Tax=Cognaticolwellia mytili TaxID=1888913 RepID=UPI0011802E30|nr:ATP-binding protein [Cognaticolwellia mytili]